MSGKYSRVSIGGGIQSIRVRFDDGDLAGLIAKLREFGPRVARKHLRSAVNRASTPVLKTARRIAPRGRGVRPGGRPRPHMYSVLTKRIRTYKNSGAVVAVIGPEKNAAPHANLVRSGAKPHKIYVKKYAEDVTKRFSFRPGMIIDHPGFKPNPFLERALSQERKRSFHIIRARMGKALKELSRKRESRQTRNFYAAFRRGD